MKGSDLFLECLKKQGVKTIFGVPGEENADMMISLIKHPIQFITCPHEQTASFMANMHGLLTNAPGVCLATLGPGATNFLTGVAQANLDGSPLIAIVGQADTKRLHKISHQNINSIEMFKPVTKWATTILSPDVIPEVIAKAFKIATSDRPGAVLIELPEDIASYETDAHALSKSWGYSEEEASQSQLEHFIRLLEASKKPLLLLGDGAMEAKRLFPNKNVIALCGDGGFIMSIQALFTGVAERIPFVVVVWEDHHYGLIKWKQEMHYHQHSHTTLCFSDLAKISSAIGCHAKRLNASEEFIPALHWALAHKTKPTVIVVPVDYRENMKLFYHLQGN